MRPFHFQSVRMVCRVSLLLIALTINLHPSVFHAQQNSSNKILFVSDRAQGPSIFLIGADGTALGPIAEGMEISSTAWSPDGNHIAYISRQDGNLEVYVMDADGFNPRRLTNNQEQDSFPGWSPDGKHILFTTLKPDGMSTLNVIDADGGNLRALLKQNDSLSAAWSPDGKSIVYGSQTGLFVMTSDGKNRHRIAPGGYDPSWSPDSKQIVYVKTEGEHKLAIVGFDGKGLQTPRSLASSPVWSPDGAEIAFFYWGYRGPNYDYTEAGIYIRKLDAEETRLLHAGDVGGIAWSPDGKQLVFQSKSSRNLDIYAMNADGSAVTRLTDALSIDYSPILSPNGEQIVFLSSVDRGYYGTTSDMYIMNADGTNTGLLGDGDNPVWSPDSKQIAFYGSGLSYGDSGIYIINIEDGQYHLVTSNGSAPLAWSPNGKQLVIRSLYSEGLFIVDADGKNERQLANDMTSKWQVSPDGSSLAYISTKDDRLYVMSLDGKNIRSLDQTVRYNSFAWSPDSKQLALNSSISQGSLTPGIYVLSLESNKKRQIVKLATNTYSDITWLPDGQHIVFNADFEGNSELYSVSVDGSNLNNITNHYAYDTLICFLGTC